MQNHVEVNVGIKKEQKGAEKGLQASIAAGKFLGNKALKAAFALDFESLFLDMFTEIETFKPVKIQEAPQQRLQVEKNEENFKEDTLLKNSDNFNSVNNLPKSTETSEKNESNTSLLNTADKSNRDETNSGDDKSVKAENKVSTEAPKETAKTETEKISVKMIRLELTAALQKKLSADDLNDLKKKIDDLFDKDEISVGVFVSEVMNILSEIAGEETLPKIAEQLPQDSGRDIKRVVKQLMKEVGEAVKDALSDAKLQNSEVIKTADEKPAADVLIKLIGKIKEKPVEEIKTQLEVSGNVDETLQNKIEDVKEDFRKEFVKTNEIRKQITKNEANNANDDVGIKDEVKTAVLPDAESVINIKAKARPQNTVQTVSLNADSLGEISRSARASEGAQNSWQHSYNQNSAQRELNKANNTQKSGTPQRTMQNQIFEQIVQNIKISITEGKSEATIRLKPEFLGRVEMKVSVEDGKVNVKFTAENNAVRAAINENVQELKKQLSELGLEVENVTVLVAGEFTDANTDNRDSDDNPAREGRRVNAGPIEDEEEEVEEAPRAVVDGSTVRYVA